MRITGIKSGSVFFILAVCVAILVFVVPLFRPMWTRAYYMMKSIDRLKPSSDKALVYFISPEDSFKRSGPVRIFDGGHLIGVLSEPNSYFGYLCESGQHIFIANSDQIFIGDGDQNYLKADLDVHKTYYVKINVKRNQRIFLGIDPGWTLRLMGIKKYDLRQGAVSNSREFIDSKQYLESKLVTLKKWERKNKKRIQAMLAGYKAHKDKEYYLEALNREDGF